MRDAAHRRRKTRCCRHRCRGARLCIHVAMATLVASISGARPCHARPHTCEHVSSTLVALKQAIELYQLRHRGRLPDVVRPLLPGATGASHSSERRSGWRPSRSSGLSSLVGVPVDPESAAGSDSGSGLGSNGSDHVEARSGMTPGTAFGSRGPWRVQPTRRSHVLGLAVTGSPVRSAELRTRPCQPSK
jgi:hypothetical protein